MNDVTILHEAEVELWDAVAYYEDRSPGLGLDFAAEIERSVQVIGGSPERWPLRQDGTRRYLTHRFPFLVVYEILADEVMVLAVAHVNRRPNYWIERAD